MSSQANWNSVTGIATLLFDGNLVAIAIAILFTLLARARPHSGHGTYQGCKSSFASSTGA
jgi:hypothetical protein